MNSSTLSKPSISQDRAHLGILSQEQHHPYLSSDNVPGAVHDASCRRKFSGNGEKRELTIRLPSSPVHRQSSAPATPSLSHLKERCGPSSPFDSNLLDLSTSLRELKVSLNSPNHQKSSSLLSDAFKVHHSQPNSPMLATERNHTPLIQSNSNNHRESFPFHHGRESSIGGNPAKTQASETSKPKGEPSACIFVASLNATRNDEQLRESVQSNFSEYGLIIDIKVMRDSQGRPFAFVQYETIEAAKKALVQGHQKALDGRPVRVEQARVNRTLFITKYDRNLTESQIRSELDTFGQMDELKFLRNAVSGRSKGCCFVRYHFREDAIKAFNGVRTKYHWNAEWTENLEKREAQVEPFEIFVGQLDPLLVTEQELFSRFKKYGYIQRVQLVRRNYPGRAIRPSFAFITFTTTSAAENAINAENGQEWNNRPLKVTHKELYAEESNTAVSGGGDIGTAEVIIPEEIGGEGIRNSVEPQYIEQQHFNRGRDHSGGKKYSSGATQNAPAATQMYPTPYRQRTWSTASSTDSFLNPYPMLPIQSPYSVPYFAFAIMPSSGAISGDGLQPISEGMTTAINNESTNTMITTGASGATPSAAAIPISGMVPTTPPMTPMGYDLSSMMHVRTPTGPEQYYFGASSPPIFPAYYYPMQTMEQGAGVATTDANMNIAGTSPIFVPFMSYPQVQSYSAQQ